jgi:hypothetical protein
LIPGSDDEPGIFYPAVPECIHTGTVATPATEARGIALFPFPLLVPPSGQKISRGSADPENASPKIGALNFRDYFQYKNPLFHRQLPDSKKNRIL